MEVLLEKVGLEEVELRVVLEVEVVLEEEVGLEVVVLEVEVEELKVEVVVLEVELRVVLKVEVVVLRVVLEVEVLRRVPLTVKRVASSKKKGKEKNKRPEFGQINIKQSDGVSLRCR